MVVEARKDAKSGSEDLQTYAWVMYGIGGTIACLLGGWLDGIWKYGGGAQVSFAITAVFVAVLGIGGFFINPELEKNQTDMVAMSFWPRTKFVFA